MKFMNLATTAPCLALMSLRVGVSILLEAAALNPFCLLGFKPLPDILSFLGKPIPPPLPSPQRIARLSSKSRSQQLLSSLDQSRSRQPLNFPVSMSLGLDNLKIFKSQLVSVSTTLEKLSLGKSRSRQLPYKNSDNLPLKPIARQGYQGTTIR